MSKAFGEQNPSQGETAVSWQIWSDGVTRYAIPDIGAFEYVREITNVN